jgi:hypothetical protein
MNGAGVRGGELDIKERTLSFVGSSGSRAGFDEASSRIDLSDRFTTAQLPFIFPKVSPRVSPKVSPVILLKRYHCC